MEKTIKTTRLTLEAQLENPSVFAFEIFIDAEVKTQLGVASVSVFKEDEAVQLSVYIEPAYRRLGYGLEAADAIIEEIVKSFPKYELLAAAATDDEAANRFCERLDFIFDCCYADENINVYYM